MTTPTFPQGWNLNPDKCPVDLEFIEWIKRQPLSRPRNILHMGTGLHHSVGVEITGDYVLGLTISPDEIQSYIELISKHPYISGSYKVLFSDIHFLNHRELPKLDYISLFHLGEIVQHPGLGGMLEWVIDEMALSLRASGRILAYSKSAAWDIVQPLFDSMLELVEEYKTLRIYKTK